MLRDARDMHIDTCADISAHAARVFAARCCAPRDAVLCMPRNIDYIALLRRLIRLRRVIATPMLARRYFSCLRLIMR